MISLYFWTKERVIRCNSIAFLSLINLYLRELNQPWLHSINPCHARGIKTLLFGVDALEKLQVFLQPVLLRLNHPQRDARPLQVTLSEQRTHKSLQLVNP